jgi:hypothetical protein
VTHGLDRHRCWGGRIAKGILHAFQRGFYTLNGMRDTAAARMSPTSLHMGVAKAPLCNQIPTVFETNAVLHCLHLHTVLFGNKHEI